MPSSYQTTVRWLNRNSCST